MTDLTPAIEAVAEALNDDLQNLGFALEFSVVRGLSKVAVEALGIEQIGFRAGNTAKTFGALFTIEAKEIYGSRGEDVSKWQPVYRLKALEEGKETK